MGCVRAVLLALALVAPMVAPAPVSGATSIEAACPATSLPATDFADATGTHGDAVRCLYWHGLAGGRHATYFGTNDRVTRGQLASLVARTLTAAGAHLPAPDEPRFADAAGSPHAEAIEQLAEAGILLGTRDGRAEPGANVRRGQVASIVVRGIEYLEEAALPRGEDAFDDDDGAVHELAIDAAAAAGLVAGVAGRRFQPGSSMTRGQGATIVARTLQRFVSDGRMELPAEPDFRWEAGRIPADVREEMRGVSWEPGCPVGLDELSLVVLTHRDFGGRIRRGELVVRTAVADDLERVFSRLYDAGVPLERVERIERFGGDDDRSMDANNTSAFNCRTTTGGSRWSEHAHGTAVDLNPVQNPYVRGDEVAPTAGRAYRDRSNVRPGMFVEGGATVEAFDAIGWEWGGRWSSLKDYMHFSATGR